MGQLIDGVWHDTGMTPNLPGKFQRSASAFRNWLTADGALLTFPAKADSPQKKIVTICTFPLPAPGRIARSFSVN